MSHGAKLIRGVVLAFCCNLSWTASAQSVCGGRVAPPNKTTRPGANELISIIERKPRKSVFGIVNDSNGQPLEDVLVEVFSPPIKKDSNEQKKRIIACTTDSRGRFCFTKLRAGRYEVVYSMDGGWKQTSLSVRLAPNSSRSVNQRIEISLQVGT
jgi:5-hydroxyisourate hydrolase-like protein (transthyretin family)